MKKTIGMGGFTLAEVLITLGIIGVVAAMTMPTLINSTQGAQYKTAFKKSLTVLSQAVVMNIALNDYDLSQVVAGTNYDTDAAEDAAGPGAQTLYDMFHNRLNIVREANTEDFNANANDSNQWIIVSDNDSGDYKDFATNHALGAENAVAGAGGGNNQFPTLTAGQAISTADATVMFMNDGIAFIFDNQQSNCQQGNDDLGTDDNYCFGFIDVNGQKAPNRVVQCDGGIAEGDAGEDDATCQVSSPTDIYPIAMYNQSVIPASSDERAVLYIK